MCFAGFPGGFAAAFELPARHAFAIGAVGAVADGCFVIVERGVFSATLVVAGGNTGRDRDTGHAQAGRTRFAVAGHCCLAADRELRAAFFAEAFLARSERGDEHAFASRASRAEEARIGARRAFLARGAFFTGRTGRAGFAFLARGAGGAGRPPGASFGLGGLGGWIYLKLSLPHLWRQKLRRSRRKPAPTARSTCSGSDAYVLDGTWFMSPPGGRRGRTTPLGWCVTTRREGAGRSRWWVPRDRSAAPPAKTVAAHQSAGSKDDFAPSFWEQSPETWGIWVAHGCSGGRTYAPT